MLPGRARDALTILAERLAEAFGERLRLLRLFGSAARGEYGPDSDLDVVVVLEGLRYEDARIATRIASEIALERGVLISALPMSPEHLDLLRRTEQRLARDIDEEGVPL